MTAGSVARFGDGSLKYGFELVTGNDKGRLETLDALGRRLEVDRNVAEFGPGIFGAAAEREVVFGKPASALSLSDAALLAAVLPNPKRMSARKPSAYVSERAGQIEQVARHLGVPFIAGI